MSAKRKSQPSKLADESPLEAAAAAAAATAAQMAKAANPPHQPSTQPPLLQLPQLQSHMKPMMSPDPMLLELAKRTRNASSLDPPDTMLHAAAAAAGKNYNEQMANHMEYLKAMHASNQCSNQNSFGE